MTYSTLIFASVILPISVLVLFFDHSAEYKNLILCIMSVIFISWGHSVLSALVLLSMLADYFLALGVGKLRESSKGAAAALVAADLAWNAAIFFLFARNGTIADGSRFKIAESLVPVGAAFYTLRNFTYVFDVFKGRCRAEKNPAVLFTYTSAYPFLLAGPVTRYADIEPQLRERHMDVHLLSEGLTRFAFGFAKTILAVPVLTKLYETGLSHDEPTLAGAWIGMICFFGSAYFTFMGLSDMGTGIARMNGFSVDVNYTPICTKHGISSLVRSANTSMIDLCADIRGEGAASKALLNVPLALMATAFYYSEPRYLLVGLAAGVIMTVEALFGFGRLEKIPAFIRVIVTAALAMLVFSGLAFGSFGEWKSWLGQLAGRGDLYILSKPMKKLLVNNCWLLAVSFISVTPIVPFLAKRAEASSGGTYTRARALRTAWAALLLILSFVMLAGDMIA